FYDYGSEKGYIVVDRSTMLRYLPDPAPSGIAVYLAPGANVDDVRKAIEKITAGRNVLIFTNRNLRAEAIRVFDRTFAITYALELVAVVVAIVGIAGALLTVVIDRRRELGLLIFVINKQSFGWTIQLHWPATVLFSALTLVFLATVLSGFYPARVATRM